MSKFIATGIAESLVGACHLIAATYATVGTDTYNDVLLFLSDFVKGSKAVMATEIIDGEIKLYIPKSYVDELAVVAFGKFGQTKKE